MDKISTYQSIFNCTREEAIEKANKVQKNYKRIKALSKEKKKYLLCIRKFFWRTSGSFEEGSKINNRAIKKEPKKALRNNIVKKSNPLIL